jgi:uncharacterized Zn-binding protein involved in type VI secretion
LPAINTHMPAVSRHRDKCATGHGCNRTAPVLSSQFQVHAEGKPILRKGDRVAPHVRKNPAPVPPGKPCIKHKANLTGGSRSVFVNGKPLGRYGDRADFGKMIRGADTVFAG